MADHARYEMENEEFGRIVEREVYEDTYNGEVIEEYPDDKPYPSALIFGKTTTDRPLHMVCAYAEVEVENFQKLVKSLFQ